MRVGVAKEIKPQESRVALTPAGARELVQRGHEVLVEASAGVGSAFSDEAYERAGASIGSVDDVWSRSELLLKVKEPIAPEYPRLRPGLTLFTYLHIAADEPLTRALVDSGVTAIAYETVETPDGALPLLAPMSEIAGRLAPQAGAHYLEKPKGGRGILLGGVAGVAPARALVIGGGMVGYNAAIDQGGCAETSRPTTHDEPVYTVDGVVHYCVANMPGAVPITSTRALTNVTLPYAEEIADHGVVGAIRRDDALARGVNVVGGRITYEAVAEAHGLDHTSLDDALAASVA